MTVVSNDYINGDKGLWVRDTDYSYKFRRGANTMPVNLTDLDMQVVLLNKRTEEFNAELNSCIQGLERQKPLDTEDSIDYLIWKAHYERALAILSFDFKWFNKQKKTDNTLKFVEAYAPLFNHINYTFERETVKCYALDDDGKLKNPEDWYNAYENEVFEWTWLKESEITRLKELILTHGSTFMYSSRRTFCKAFNPDKFKGEPRTLESDQEYLTKHKKP